MIDYILNGFNSELEKIATIKETLPWAVSRGLTGGLSTIAIGLTMNDAMKKMNKKDAPKDMPSKLKALIPVAGTGVVTGLTKGMAEKGIENAMTKLLLKK